MARIRQITPAKGHARVHPTEVDCAFQVVRSSAGDLLQLATYGSDSRQSQPKVSQTIQIDREHAEELVRILRSTFPGLDVGA